MLICMEKMVFFTGAFIVANIYCWCIKKLTMLDISGMP